MERLRAKSPVSRAAAPLNPVPIQGAPKLLSAKCQLTSLSIQAAM